MLFGELPKNQEDIVTNHTCISAPHLDDKDAELDEIMTFNLAIKLAEIKPHNSNLLFNTPYIVKM